MKNDTDDDPPGNQEITKRRDEALRRALNTPPQHKHGMAKESKVPHPAPAAKPKRRGRVASGS